MLFLLVSFCSSAISSPLEDLCFICLFVFTFLDMADCGTCLRRVVKSAKALACGFCKMWYHMPCAGLTDNDYEFMKSRRGLGFRWFCGKCISDADDAIGSGRTADRLEGTLSDIVAAVDGINKRLGDLEAKSGPVGGSTPETFAGIIKKTLREVQKSEDPDMRVTDHGHTRIVKNEEVLVLKPRCPDESQATQSSVPLDGLRNILKSIPVKSCRETGRGNVVVKFPHAGAREEAKALVGSSTSFRDIVVSEPRKMLPKMTLLDVPPSLPDSEIVSGIQDKNPKIKELVDAGHTLTLVFCRTKGDKKMAVIKMSPDVRNVMVGNGNRVFLGLTSCRTFDRFWATQCHHCQKFGHTKERCPTKSASPVCGLCAGSHITSDCTDRSALKCVNCSSQGNPPERCHHSASSLDCPVMISERNRVIENTEFGSSKNV